MLRRGPDQEGGPAKSLSFETLACDVHTVSGDSDGGVVAGTGIGVPGQLASPVLAGDGDLVATGRPDGEIECSPDAAVETLGLVDEYGPVRLGDRQLQRDRRCPVVLNREFEATLRVSITAATKTPCREDDQNDQ